MYCSLKLISLMFKLQNCIQIVSEVLHDRDKENKLQELVGKH